MKKIVYFSLLVLLVMGLVSCTKKEITTDDQAKEALIASYEKLYSQPGAIMDMTFDVSTTIEGMPMNFNGTIVLGYTTKPEFSADMDMTITTQLIGMDMDFPVRLLYEVEGEEMVMYVNALNTWMKSSSPYPADLLGDSMEFTAKYIDTMSDINFVGKTQINEIPVYEINVKIKEDAFTRLMAELDDAARSDFELQMAESELTVADFDALMAGLSFPVYLKQQDNSLYGTSIDIGSFTNQLMNNMATMGESEIPLLDLTGTLLMILRDEVPTGIYTVPQEAKDTATSLEDMEESLGGNLL